jgi:hypothetical protein
MEDQDDEDFEDSPSKGHSSQDHSNLGHSRHGYGLSATNTNPDKNPLLKIVPNYWTSLRLVENHWIIAQDHLKKSLKREDIELLLEECKKYEGSASVGENIMHIQDIRNAISKQQQMAMKDKLDNHEEQDEKSHKCNKTNGKTGLSHGKNKALF